MCVAALSSADHGAKIRKAWSFPKAIFFLGDLLAKAAGPHEARMVAAARTLLGVDWSALSPSDRTARLRAVVADLRSAGARVGAAVRPPLEKAGEETMRGARTRARTEHHLPVAADFNQTDRGMLARLPALEALFVRDQMGRRADAFGARARSIVARGLQEGLGRGDIADDLREAAAGLRAPPYWDVVAGSFMGTTRSLGELSAYAEAGVAKYQVVAVRDEHTTPFCLYVDGTEFSVGETLKRWEETSASADPLAIKTDFPWARATVSSGETELWFRRGEDRIPIAKVDSEGRSAEPRSSERLAELGFGMPPYHGLCRTTVLPIL